MFIIEKFLSLFHLTDFRGVKCTSQKVLQAYQVVLGFYLSNDKSHTITRKLRNFVEIGFPQGGGTILLL